MATKTKNVRGDEVEYEDPSKADKAAAEAEATGEKAVWDVSTHGEPPKEDGYVVIGEPVDAPV